MIDMALSLAQGEEIDPQTGEWGPAKFLGRFAVNRPCNVGMMSGESGLATLRETFLRIAESKGFDPQGEEGCRFHLCDRLPNLSDGCDLLGLQELVIAKELEILICDPAYLMLQLSGNKASNLFAVGSQLQKLTSIGQKTGATIILVHHTIKSQKGSPSLGSIAWAGFAEWARQWILISRRSPYSGRGRHRLKIMAGGSSGHSTTCHATITEGLMTDEGGRYWDARVRLPSDPRPKGDSPPLTPDQQRVVDALKANGAAMTLYQIRRATGLNGSRGLTTVRDLKRSSVVKTEETTRGSKTYTGYRLTEFNRSSRSSTGQAADQWSEFDTVNRSPLSVREGPATSVSDHCEPSSVVDDWCP